MHFPPRRRWPERAGGGVLSTLRQSSAAGQREASGKRNQLTNVRRYMMPRYPFTIAPATVTVFGQSAYVGASAPGQSAPVAEKAIRFQGSTPAGGPIELNFPHLSSPYEAALHFSGERAYRPPENGVLFSAAPAAERPAEAAGKFLGGICRTCYIHRCGAVRWGWILSYSDMTFRKRYAILSRYF